MCICCAIEQLQMKQLINETSQRTSCSITVTELAHSRHSEDVSFGGNRETMASGRPPGRVRWEIQPFVVIARVKALGSRSYLWSHSAKLVNYLMRSQFVPINQSLCFQASRHTSNFEHQYFFDGQMLRWSQWTRLPIECNN